jgi:hypothetical protein
MLMHHHLPSGARVRLRLPVRADTESLRDLVGEEAAERLLRFDPRRQAVVCALDFEEVVGVGAIELLDGARPELMAVADGRGEELTDLLESVLVARAQEARRPPRARRSMLPRLVRRTRRP